MHDDGYFDERVAARYDRSAADMFAPGVVGPIVDFLAELAGSGRALELGIGTARMAVSLARRGVAVYAIELSRPILARLRAKPGAEDIGVTPGDFANTIVDGTFSLAYLVFNTIMKPHLAGRLLPKRGGPPRARRLFCRRGRCAGPPGASAG